MRLFSKVDWLLHHRKTGPAASIQIDPANYPGRICAVPLENRGGVVSLADPSAGQALDELSLDLILYFGENPIADQFHASAVYGCCTYAGEFLEWRIPERMPDFLFQLVRGGPEILKKNVYTSTFPLKRNWTARRGPAGRYFLLLMKIILRKLVNRLLDACFTERWEIAYRFSGQPILKTPVFQTAFRLKPPIQKIYADPFPVEHQGRYFLFFEEMDVDGGPQKKRGCISVVEIDREKGPVGKIQRVLQRDYHLSYPFLFRWDGRLFMLPETHQNGSVELYRCVAFPGEWEFCRTLLDGITAVDATLYEKDGRWWLFASVPQTEGDYSGVSALPHLYALNLYFADSPLGEWRPHPQNPVKLDRTSSRCAGSLHIHGGQVYRPAQDCTPRYGHSVVLHRIIKMTPTEYLEVEEKRIIPPARGPALGVHTFNACGDFQAVDFIGRRSRLLP